MDTMAARPSKTAPFPSALRVPVRRLISIYTFWSGRTVRTHFSARLRADAEN